MAPQALWQRACEVRAGFWVADARARGRGGATLDALFACARAGDRRAFRRVTERLSPRLVRYVSLYLKGDEHTARDVVQDTFIAAWCKLDTIRDGGHLMPWLYRVARCKAITWLRRRGPKGAPMDSIQVAQEMGQDVESGAGWDPARLHLDGPVSEALVRAVRRAVAKLPPIYAGVVRLHYLQGHGTRETAHLLGVPRTTVKMRLYRARQKLRALLRDEL